MSTPLEEIRKEEEKKKKALDKRREVMKATISRKQEEYKQQLENRKEELAEELKSRLLDLRNTESEKLKGEILRKKKSIESWKQSIISGQKLDEAVKTVLAAFLKHS